MLYFFTPYSTEKDIGKAYNQYMSLLPNDDDWAVLMDGDSMFLLPDFGHHIQSIIDKYPDVGLFTCYTNRVGCKEQCYNNILSEDPNILNHKQIALNLQREKRNNIKEIKKVISGVVMIVNKKTWEHVGKFPEEMGILSVDNHFSAQILRNRRKIFLMEGVYVLHFYRLDTGIKEKSHLLV